MRDYFKRLFQALAWAGLILLAPPAHAAPDLQVLVMGDSLSAEYGLERGKGWVQLLATQLETDSANRGPRIPRFVNASVSGETTAGGRTRLPALLNQHHPDIVIIELGANDALRGLDVKTTKANLDAMVQASQAIKAKVLLVGMQVPPNYGKRYADDFARTFADVAETRHVALMPFLLKDVADRPDAKDWFQGDGLHPLAKAHPLIAKNILAALKPLLLGR